MGEQVTTIQKYSVTSKDFSFQTVLKEFINYLLKDWSIIFKSVAFISWLSKCSVLYVTKFCLMLHNNLQHDRLSDVLCVSSPAGKF